MPSRNQIGLFGVIALVLLRVATGWHFFDQGLDKFEPGFSSEGFLRAAKGPLAEHYHELAHGVHNVDTLLLVPNEWTDETPSMIASQVGWQRGYESRQKKANHPDPKKRVSITEVETPPDAPFTPWLDQITADWEQYSLAAAQTAGGGETARAACRELFLAWQGRLARYLSEQAEAMAEYQNERWRLDQLGTEAPAGELPYNDQRTAKKQGKTFSQSRKWVADVRALEALYRNDLVAAAMKEGAEQGKATAAVDPPTRLDRINQVVKWTVVGVGVCLMLGFWTRLAALVGGVFLCSVIATQPPWVHGAYTEYFWYQLVEVAGMLVIAVFGAGQWLGVDAVFKGLRKVN